MAGVRFLGIHRTWEDWATIILGLLTVVSPWFAGVSEPPVVVWNTLIVGALIIAIGALELYRLQLWEEGAQFLCGLWLLASPFNLGYDGTLRSCHVVLGALVMLLAVVELFQDWKLSDEQLARHGE